MLHVLPLGYQENMRRATVGDGCSGELFTEVLPRHQGWEKRRKRMQKPAGLLSAVREALSGAGRMFCWQCFSAFLHGASFSTVIFSPWFVRRSASPTKDSLPDTHLLHLLELVTLTPTGWKVLRPPVSRWMVCVISPPSPDPAPALQLALKGLSVFRSAPNSQEGSSRNPPKLPVVHAGY